MTTLTLSRPDFEALNTAALTAHAGNIEAIGLPYSPDEYAAAVDALRAATAQTGDTVTVTFPYPVLAPLTTLWEVGGDMLGAKIPDEVSYRITEMLRAKVGGEREASMMLVMEHPMAEK
jgi:hypothetical protein